MAGTFKLKKKKKKKKSNNNIIIIISCWTSVLKLQFTEERAAAVLGLFLSLSLPLKPQRGLSFLMKYSPNDLPGPCCSNHSQGKHWSDERAPALPVGAFTQWPGHGQDRVWFSKFQALSCFCSAQFMISADGKHKAKVLVHFWPPCLWSYSLPPPMLNILYYLAKNIHIFNCNMYCPRAGPWPQIYVLKYEEATVEVMSGPV